MPLINYNDQKKVIKESNDHEVTDILSRSLAEILTNKDIQQLAKDSDIDISLTIEILRILFESNRIRPCIQVTPELQHPKLENILSAHIKKQST